MRLLHYVPKCLLMVTTAGVGGDLAALVNQAPGSLDETVRSSTPVKYEKALKCGPNALFVFLQLVGQNDVRLEEVENEVSISRRGTSLLELSKASKAFGVGTEVRRYSKGNLKSVPLPAVLQFHSGGAAAAKYHFFVVYKLRSNRVGIIDPTTARKTSAQVRATRDGWTGYALIRKSRLWAPFGRLLMYITGCGVIATCMYAGVRGGMRARQRAEEKANVTDI